MSTAENLRMKSENLKKGIGTLLAEIVNTNNQIVNQIAANESAVAQANASIEQLNRDNVELIALKVDNEDFIKKIEDILAAELITPTYPVAEAE